MSWGPPIDQAVFAEPAVYVSPHTPELIVLPEMEAMGTKQLKMMDRIQTRLPAMPAGLGDKSLESGKAEAAEKLAAELKVAYGITRGQNKINKKRAKAKGKAVQRIIDRGAREGPRQARRIGANTIRGEDANVRHMARNMGIGTDLYKNVRL